MERRRERSPNYPSIGFAEALELARKILEKERGQDDPAELGIVLVAFTEHKPEHSKKSKVGDDNRRASTRSWRT